MSEGRLEVRLSQAQPIPLAVEFSCGRGEMVALVGPSGSGKTTILRAIAGLFRPGAGEIRLGEAVWFDRTLFVGPRDRRAGFVFQHYALFPHLSAAANVEIALLELDPKSRAGRARQLLELVHLAGLEDRLPRTLSGGQQQRVALARALAREPTVLLLDEPFSAVDQVTRRRLQAELAQLRDRIEMPIVLVTHDLEEAGHLADRMVVLSRGTTLQDGTPFEVMARPRSIQVARLVDFRNLFDGTVSAHEPDRDLTVVTWRNLTLEARYRPEFKTGERVCWGILPAYCILHRRDRPSRGERENPVAGVVATAVRFGETTAITMHLGGDPAAALMFTVPLHVANRNGIVPGVEAKVSLLKEGLHLMPPEAG